MRQLPAGHLVLSDLLAGLLADITTSLRVATSKHEYANFLYSEYNEMLAALSGLTL